MESILRSVTLAKKGVLEQGFHLTILRREFNDTPNILRALRSWPMILRVMFGSSYIDSSYSSIWHREGAIRSYRFRREFETYNRTTKLTRSFSQFLQWQHLKPSKRSYDIREPFRDHYCSAIILSTKIAWKAKPSRWWIEFTAEMPTSRLQFVFDSTNESLVLEEISATPSAVAWSIRVSWMLFTAQGTLLDVSIVWLLSYVSTRKEPLQHNN